MRLGDLVKLYKGRKPLEIVNEPIEGYRRSLQISDLRPGAKPRYCPADKKELLAVPNDVIIAWDGANAGTTSHGLKGSVGSTLMVLRIQQEELIDTAYLGHFIASKQSYLRAKAKGATIPHLDRVILESLDVPLPPLEEQKRIVSILDKAKSIQEARERQLTSLNDLLMSVFKDSFPAENYQVKSIKEIATVLSGGTPRSSIEEYWNGDIEWITPADLGQHQGIYFSSSSRKITDSGLKNSSAVILPPGSVMMSSRAPIGHLAINTVPMATNQGFKSIIPGQEITNLYLFFWLKYHMSYVKSLGMGATFKEISKKNVENIRVPVPPLAEQENFSRKVEKIICQYPLINKSIKLDMIFISSLQSTLYHTRDKVV